MRSQYTLIYCRKSPVPSRELYTILLAHTHNLFVTQLCAPAHRGLLTYYLLITLDLRTIPRTAHNLCLTPNFKFNFPRTHTAYGPYSKL